MANQFAFEPIAEPSLFTLLRTLPEPPSPMFRHSADNMSLYSEYASYWQSVNTKDGMR